MTKYEPVKMPKKKEENGTKKEQNKQRKKPSLIQKVQMIEDFLNYSYDFRYNTVTCRTEAREIDKDDKFRAIEDFELNSILRRMRQNGISATRNFIKETLNSDFTEKCNPILSYFNNLSHDKGKDYIDELCKTMKTTIGHEKFVYFFKKWFTGMVANCYITTRCTNHLCLILAGGQGIGKSTWLRKIIPDDLSQYYYENKIDPESKDDLIRTAECLLINLDDYFDDISKAKVNAFKGFITNPIVKTRRPYALFDEIRPRIASFAATCNDVSFLYDSTGSRRFLALEVTHIDYNALDDINLDQIYAQAVKLFKDGWQYWLTKEEEADLQRNNEQFEVQTLEFELVNKYFRLPRKDELQDKTFKYLTNTEIKQKLEIHTKDTVRPKKVGEALKKIGFERVNVRFGEGNKFKKWVYKCVPIEPSDTPTYDQKMQQNNLPF